VIRLNLIGTALVLGLLTPAPGVGQRLVLQDSLTLRSLKNFGPAGTSLVACQVIQDLTYGLSGSGMLFFNWDHDWNKNSAMIQHQLKYRILVNVEKHLLLSNTLSHVLGFQWIFDSINRFQPDENVMETRLALNLSDKIHFMFHSRLNTRLFESFDYHSTLTGAVERVLAASFLTPLQMTFSTGFGLKIPDWLTLDLGLTGVKFTYVLNQEIFRQQGVELFYGVPNGKDHVFEYGMTMHLLIDKDLLKWIHWNCDLLLFKDFNEPVDVTLKSLLGVKINRFLKTSLQTRLFYEEAVSRKIQVENTLLFGVAVSL
jgi:hypothetical protein